MIKETKSLENTTNTIPSLEELEETFRQELELYITMEFDVTLADGERE